MEKGQGEEKAEEETCQKTEKDAGEVHGIKQSPSSPLSTLPFRALYGTTSVKNGRLSNNCN
ncbi:MAG: hypothetical protein DPW15_15655 [Chloroflexi bacterium]|nr:hypothetical protein [Chloroflexota bacterium]